MHVWICGSKDLLTLFKVDAMKVMLINAGRVHGA